MSTTCISYRMIISLAWSDHFFSHGAYQLESACALLTLFEDILVKISLKRLVLKFLS